MLEVGSFGTSKGPDRRVRPRPSKFQEVCLDQARCPCLALPSRHRARTACATQGPSGPTAWRDPSYRGPQFHKIFVVGLGPQSLADVPGFEDLMVSTLQSGGIPAVAGYRFVPSDRAPD